MSSPARPGCKPRKGDADRILADLLQEYEPRTTVLKETCEHLARAYAELKTIPAGSLEWHRILNITQELSALLERSRPTLAEAAVVNLEQLSPDEVGSPSVQKGTCWSMMASCLRLGTR